MIRARITRNFNQDIIHVALDRTSNVQIKMSIGTYTRYNIIIHSVINFNYLTNILEIILEWKKHNEMKFAEVFPLLVQLTLLRNSRMNFPKMCSLIKHRNMNSISTIDIMY